MSICTHRLVFIIPIFVIILTVCKQSLRRLFFYTYLSVILFKGGVCLNACWDSRCPQGASTPRTRQSPGPDPSSQDQSLLPRTRDPSRDQTPPVQCMLGDMGNKQMVCILLECILVHIYLMTTVYPD